MPPAIAAAPAQVSHVPGTGPTSATAETGLAGLDGLLPLVDAVPEWLSPLTAVVPGQVAGMRIGAALGSDVDRPAGLQKVTLTR